LRLRIGGIGRKGLWVGDFMPRLFFDKEEEFVRWARAQKDGYYYIFLTRKKEIILFPKRSTRPIMVGYYKAKDSKNAEEIVKKLMEEKQWDLYNLSNLEWDIERPPGVEVVII